MQTQKTRCHMALRKALVPAAFAVLASTPLAHAGQQDADVHAQMSAVQASEGLTDRIIIKYKNEFLQGQGVSAMSASMPDGFLQNASARAGEAMSMVRRMHSGAHVLKVNGKRSYGQMKKLAARLAADPNVEYAEPDRILKPMFTPNDSRYNEQWHYFENTGGLNLPAAWDVTAGAGVTVAVLDTGYRPHSDLAANLLPGYDMITDTFVSRDGDGRDSDASDPGDWVTANECGNNNPAQNSSWHGTHVAGTIAAVTNNGTGVAGVAYQSKIVPVRVLGRCGGYTSDIADGIIWAAGGSVSGVPANANPADVINLSLGGGGTCDTTTFNAVDTARGLGATVIVAAGNSNDNAANYSPASCSNVITVAATNRSGGRAYYSNYGSPVDVAAPGGDVRYGSSNGILSTLNSGSTTPGSDNYSFFQGTSMAAPHVAGVAALMYAVKPSITPSEVETILETTARSFPASCSQCGSGIVDALAAVNEANGGTPPPSGNELSNGVAKTGLSGASGSQVFFTLEVPAGASNLSFQMSGGSGDADMYVRFGSQPTTSSYDCRPYLNGNNETCTISNVQAGTYHVMLRGYTSYSNVSLVGSYTEGGSGGPGGFTESNLSGSSGSWQNFTVDVPAGASSLSVVMSGGSGDADLYVRYGANPTTSSYDCRPYKNGNNETCTFNNPSSGTWYIRLRGYSSYSGVTLDVSYQ